MSDRQARQIVFYTPETLADAHPYRIIAAGRNLVEQDDPLVTKRYHHHTLILTLSGMGLIEIRGQTFAASPGTVTWLDTSRKYAHGCHPGHGNWRYLWFGMQGYGLDTLFGRLEGLGNPIKAGHKTMQDLFEEAIVNLARKDRMIDANSTQIAARIIALFLEPRPQDVSQDNNTGPIHGAMQAFLQDPSAPWDIEKFASHSRHSLSHFHRRFKELTGVSPKKWMRQERINSAKYLLSTSNEKISWVGRRCGYPDPYHFSRVFTRLTGMTPSRFRRSGGP